MFKLFRLAFKNNWSAQTSNKTNFWSAMITMIINNVFFLVGMWFMLFQGKEQNQKLFPSYLTLTVLAYVGWGAVNFLTYGFRKLGDIIDSGKLEPMLGTPRSPLMLVAFSETSASAFGDLLQGIITLIALYWIVDLSWALRTAVCCVIVMFGFISIFIFAGTLTFFVNRGAAISSFLIESSLSFTMYPMTKVLEGNSRWILYVIPATLTATLPMAWIEDASWLSFLTMAAVVAIAFWLSIQFFYFGVKHYRAASYISAR